MPGSQSDCFSGDTWQAMVSDLEPHASEILERFCIHEITRLVGCFVTSLNALEALYNSVLYKLTLTSFANVHQAVFWKWMADDRFCAFIYLVDGKKIDLRLICNVQYFSTCTTV